MVVGAITLSGTAVVLAVAGLHVLQGDLTVGGLLVVIAYLASVHRLLSSIAYTTGKLQSAIASAAGACEKSLPSCQKRSIGQARSTRPRLPARSDSSM